MLGRLEQSQAWLQGHVRVLSPAPTEGGLALLLSSLWYSHCPDNSISLLSNPLQEASQWREELRADTTPQRDTAPEQLEIGKETVITKDTSFHMGMQSMCTNTIFYKEGRGVLSLQPPGGSEAWTGGQRRPGMHKSWV